MAFGIIVTFDGNDAAVAFDELLGDEQSDSRTDC
jgi:hypothetical protein